MADEQVEALTKLNGLYIQGVMHADANLFDTILADDFLCSQPDGTLIDRAEFLSRTRASTQMPSTCGLVGTGDGWRCPRT
jgi:hypothetical protein